jgi:uncharacterized protein (DUF952 family)
MSNDEKVKALLELLKIVAWPAFLVWVVWYLRDEVKHAAARLIELGLTGAKFAPPAPPAQIAQSPTASVSEGVGSARGAGTATAVSSGVGSSALFIASAKAKFSEDQLQPIVQELRRGLEGTFGSNPQDQAEGFVYFSAALHVQLMHERNYRMIFGSQLQLLEMMNADVGVPPAFAMNVYNTAKAAHPDIYRSITFEQWIAFLLGAGLCNVAPNGNYVLTPFGRGFLRYIVDMHLPTNKPF